MCGIAGTVDRPGTDAAPTLRAMLRTLVHRGPDDHGVECWPESGAGLGHQRLSILDLSPAGHQPMATSDGLASLVYNGEIYNFQELRRELTDAGHAFQSTSDTEVLLRAYEHWGADCLAHLRGMFAFGIWDTKRQRLLLARDRLGIKPLYYVWQGNLFAFASEPKALLAHPAVSTNVDPSAVADYLTYGYVPLDRCIFAGMRKLPAGHFLLYEGGRARLQEYWTFSPSDHDARNGASTSGLRRTLAEAVAQHLAADVPLGAFLSGGIDSSVVTALMAEANQSPIHTLAVGFDSGDSELAYAREVAARYRTAHTEEQVRAGGVEDLIRTLVHSYDEPLSDPSTIPTYLLCSAARRHVKVAISGDGGDELFAGYNRYGRMTAPHLRSDLAVRAIDRLRAWPRLARLQVVLRDVHTDVVRRYHHHVGLFDDWERRRLAGPALQPSLLHSDSLWLFRKFFRNELPLLTALQWLDLKTYLVDDILVKIDRASMAHSLEVRPPILDHEVVEMAFRIPASLQRDQSGGKSFFKKTTADLLPPSILDRDKRGFSPPTRAWFRASLWPLARKRIVDGYCVRDGLIDAAFLDWMVANYTERRWYKVWSLWFLEEWYRAWIVGPRPS